MKYETPAQHNIIHVARSLLFWISDAVPGICWSHSPSLRVTAPSAPITTGTTALFQHLFNFLRQPLVFLKLFMLLLLDVAVSCNPYIYHYCLLLSFVNHHSVRLVSHYCSSEVLFT